LEKLIKRIHQPGASKRVAKMALEMLDGRT
jgi:hypothetical protein